MSDLLEEIFDLTDSYLTAKGNIFRIRFTTTTGVIDFGQTSNYEAAELIADLIIKHVMMPKRAGEPWRIRDEYFGQLSKVAER